MKYRETLDRIDTLEIDIKALKYQWTTLNDKRSKRSKRSKRVSAIDIEISNIEGGIKGRVDELIRLKDAIAIDAHRLVKMIALAGYIVQWSEVADTGVRVELTPSTRFKDTNINAVQRKLWRLNLVPIWFEFERDQYGRYMRDENGKRINTVLRFSVNWRRDMTTANIAHQVLELGIEERGLTEV